MSVIALIHESAIARCVDKQANLQVDFHLGKWSAPAVAPSIVSGPEENETLGMGAVCRL